MFTSIPTKAPLALV